MQVEIREEGELRGCVVRPIRVSLGDGDAVVEVQDELHAEEGKEEADSVFYSSGLLDGGGGVFELGDVVVEGYDGAGEVEGGVDGVADVVAEGVVFWGGGNGDSIALGEVGRVELLLLGGISGLFERSSGGITNLYWASTSAVETPVVVQVKADQSQHCEIEQNLPS